MCTLAPMCVWVIISIMKYGVCVKKSYSKIKLNQPRLLINEELPYVKKLSLIQHTHTHVRMYE